MLRQRGERFAPNDLVVLKMDARVFNLFASDDDDEQDVPLEERSLILGFNPAVRGLNLTRLTEIELDALKTFFLEVIELARPLVRKLDAEAAAGAATGDYSYKRVWRIPPQYIDFRTTHPNFQPEGEKDDATGTESL